MKKRKNQFNQLWEMVEQVGEENGEGGYEELLAKILLLIYRRMLVLVALQGFLIGFVICVLKRL